MERLRWQRFGRGLRLRDSGFDMWVDAVEH